MNLMAIEFFPTAEATLFITPVLLPFCQEWFKLELLLIKKRSRSSPDSVFDNK